MNESAQELKKASNRGMIWGILTIIFGFLAIGAPVVSGVAVTLMIGIALLAAGVSMLIFAFQAPSLGKILLKLLFAGLTVLVGISVLTQPGIALVNLTLLLGIFFVVDGFFSFIVAWNVKPEKGWGWLVFNALVTVVLGIMILKGWPQASLFVIGILVGIRLIFAGVTMLTLGTAGRRVAKAVTD
jgi:uncharacterized membrane protein HdeD (DUF308 family)